MCLGKEAGTYFRRVKLLILSFLQNLALYLELNLWDRFSVFALNKRIYTFTSSNIIYMFGRYSCGGERTACGFFPPVSDCHHGQPVPLPAS